MNDFIKADKIIENNKRKNIQRLEIKKEEIGRKIPEYNNISDKIKQLNISLLNKIYENNENQISKIEREIKLLKEKRDFLLEENGYDEEYLNLEYNCSICEDTGEINGKICSCKKDIVNKIRLSRAKMYQAVEEENFENFDLNIFRGEKLEDEPISPKELMTMYYEDFKGYAEKFNRGSDSLYIHGPVGVGKTYICNAISSEVIKRGYNVVYMTALSLMQQLRLYLYSSFETEQEHEEKYNLLIDSDLLVIDDLGTENITENSISNLFNLINSRIIKSKPIIISTNVPIKEVPRFYDERISSRLKDFKEYELLGDDLRGREH